MRTPLRGFVVASVLLPAAPLALAGQAGPGERGPDRQTTYERVVSAHFDLPPGEARLLLEEGIRAEELPVVLLLARERGLSPSVVISRRLRADRPTAWVQVAAQMGLGAAVFHVELADDEMDPAIRQATERFRSTAPERWDTVQLSDDEIVALANLRVLSRGLGVSAARVLEARAESGSWVGAADLLVGALSRAGAAG